MMNVVQPALGAVSPTVHQVGCLPSTMSQQPECVGVPSLHASTCSGGAASSSGTMVSSSPQSSQDQGITSNLQRGGAVANMGAGSGSTDCAGPEWLYRLVTYPSYFTPCTSCCGSSRAPKREQLMTHFDTVYPYRVYCSHCPEVKVRTNGTLLQVRRSAFKDVVKAADILRYGCDVAGVQQYTLNGSKVIYLNREQAPERKGNAANTAPAICSVCKRSMMDKSSTYCSLKCKMHAEDSSFNEWLDTQDPSVRIAALAYANAPPRPTVACKRVVPTSSASSAEDNSTDSSSRPIKAARSTSTDAATACSAVLHGCSSASSAPLAAVTIGAPCLPGMGSRVMVAPPAASAFARPAVQQQQLPPPQAQLPLVVATPVPPMQRAASAAAPAAHQSMTYMAPASIKPARTMLASRQHSAPAFLEAAMADPQLCLPSQHHSGATVSGISSSSWLLAPEELDIHSPWSGCDSALSSESWASIDDAWLSDDGDVLPSLPSLLSDGGGLTACHWNGLPAGSAADLNSSDLDEACLLVPGSPLSDCDLLMMGPHSLSGAALMLH